MSVKEMSREEFHALIAFLQEKAKEQKGEKKND